MLFEFFNSIYSRCRAETSLTFYHDVVSCSAYGYASASIGFSAYLGVDAYAMSRVLTSSCCTMEVIKEYWLSWIQSVSACDALTLSIDYLFRSWYWSVSLSSKLTCWTFWWSLQTIKRIHCGVVNMLGHSDQKWALIDKHGIN